MSNNEENQQPNVTQHPKQEKNPVETAKNKQLEALSKDYNNKIDAQVKKVMDTFNIYEAEQTKLVEIQEEFIEKREKLKRAMNVL